MASKIARTSEYAVITVAAVLALSCLVSACSGPPETTGSIAPPPAVAYRQPPPAIQPVASAPSYQQAPYQQAAYQPVAYAPPPVAYAPRPVAYAPRRYVRRQPECTCNTPRRYDRDITASIPRSQPATYVQPASAGRTDFVVHKISRDETLYSISRLYGTRVADIAAVNRLNLDSPLHSGELLVVPTTVR